jgi:hypothetical protein
MDVENQIAQINTNDPNQVIEFYESNKLYFDNYQRLDNPDRIGRFLDIKLFYCNSLTDKQHVDKVLNVLNHVDDLLSKLPKDYWSYRESERHSRFLKAMALSNKKKFKESYPLFKQLVTEDPDHHSYKVWFDHAKLGLYNWIFYLASFTGIACILGYITLSELGIQLPFDIGNVGIIILGVSFFAQLGLKEYTKRKK